VRRLELRDQERARVGIGGQSPFVEVEVVRGDLQLSPNWPQPPVNELAGDLLRLAAYRQRLPQQQKSPLCWLYAVTMLPMLPGFATRTWALTGRADCASIRRA
jgi:hypothetical protein